MTRSKQTERATESQSPPTDDSDGYIDEGLAESRRKIARKQPKWLDKMTKEAEADRVAFSERVAEILEQATTHSDDDVGKLQQLYLEDVATERKERDAWELLLKKSASLVELHDQAERAVASDTTGPGLKQADADKKIAEGALLAGLEEAKGEIADVEAVRGVEKGVLRFAKVME